MALFAQKKASLQKTIVPEKPVLKTEMDSLSYAFGAMLYEQGLSTYLQQLGVVIDTAGVTSPVRLDSINKANNKNKIEFIAGIKEGMNASEAKSAFNAGVSVGGQILKLMAPQLIQQLYGQDSTEKLNSEAFLSAMESSLNGDKLEIDNPTELFNEKMQEAAAKLQAKQEEAEVAKFADQIAEGDRFMEGNKSRAGVVTLPDGLQYIIMEKGTGAIPTATDRVKVHYHGTLIDGTVFDSSLDRGEPAVFGVNQVIKGWTEALQLMPVGSKWTIYIPYDLAYGARGAGETIKPYSNLIFEVQLLDIEN
jgi:FKBP-type peptidyl-prolyl cis-trans isomerase FklB